MPEWFVGSPVFHTHNIDFGFGFLPCSILNTALEIMKLTKFVFLVVRQIYKTDGSQEYVIVGNDALIKCQYPSFVSDFLTILGWANSEGEFYSAGQDNHGIGPVPPPHCTPTLSHVSFLVIYISISEF